MSASSGFWSIAVRIARTMRDSTVFAAPKSPVVKELCPSSLQCPPCEDSRMRTHRPQTLVVRIEGEDVFYPYCLQGSRPWKYRIEGCFRMHFRPRGGAISPSWPEYPYLQMLLGLPFLDRMFSSSVEID